MVETYIQLFGEKPKEIYPSLLEKGDYPELDTSELLDADSTQKHQSMIGAMQWAIKTLLLLSCRCPASVLHLILGT